MEQAKAAGFNIRPYYLGLDSADLHGVTNRVAQGGHNIPEDIRHTKSII
jgi:predicted ABC-type ATPase